MYQSQEHTTTAHNGQEVFSIPLAQHHRLITALQSCSTQYVDFTRELGKTGVLQGILPFTTGRTLIDIGCGPAGGAAWLAKSLHASGYWGIDINRAAIEEARRRVPHATFIWDDPLAVLADIPQPACIISSGLCDAHVLYEPHYRTQLMYAIASALAPGNATIHHARGNFMQNFGTYLERAGLTRIETPWTTPHIFTKSRTSQHI